MIPTFAVVPVLFATDRNRVADESSQAKFGTARAHDLSFGTVEVSIPQYHIEGHLETPIVILGFKIIENPEKHIVVLTRRLESRKQFFSRIAANQTGEGAILFVHGFNVTFDDAARQTAQIAYDLRFHGSPVFYSWPSQGNTFFKFIVYFIGQKRRIISSQCNTH